MGGKRNKSKKFLREKHNKKHIKQNNKKKNSDKGNNNKTSNKSNKNNYKTKKAKELFNAGINALNEQPEIDVGLQYYDDDDYDDDDEDLLSLQSEDIQYSDDVISLQSEVTISIDSAIDGDEDIDDDIIDDLINNLSNKDSNIRIESLKHLNNELKLFKLNENDFNVNDNKNPRLQTISKNLSLNIRKGSITEIVTALDTVGLLSLILSRSDGLDFFIKYFQNLVKNLVQRPKSAQVQIRAINILSIMVWCYNDDAIKLSSIKLFEYFWNYQEEKEKEEKEKEKEEKEETNKLIMIEAICAWLFLITSMNDSSDIGSLLDEYYSSLLKLLRLESTTILEKIHIGKALTVLIDNYNDALINDEDFLKQNVNINAILTEFNHLKSHNSRLNSKSHKKKEFVIQKAKFRDYLKTLEHKWTPLIVIKLHHKKFQLSGWNIWIQYHAIKKILKNGLQSHLFRNKKIKNIFEIDIDAEPLTLSKHQKIDKKTKHIEKQKNIRQNRSKQRDNKREFMFDKSLLD